MIKNLPLIFLSNIEYSNMIHIFENSKLTRPLIDCKKGCVLCSFIYIWFEPANYHPLSHLSLINQLYMSLTFAGYESILHGPCLWRHEYAKNRLSVIYSNFGIYHGWFSSLLSKRCLQCSCDTKPTIDLQSEILDTPFLWIQNSLFLFYLKLEYYLITWIFSWNVGEWVKIVDKPFPSW